MSEIMINSELESNPYFERWRRGRPSKSAIDKRKLSDLWITAYRKKYPHRFPLITALLEMDIPFKKVNGKVMVKYIPRSR